MMTNPVASRPVISELGEIMPLLRAGDRIVLTLGEETTWHLLHDQRQVAADLINVLQQGGPLLEHYPGRLVGLGDSLFQQPPAPAQTWVWVEPSIERHA
jgi:hypothetical protein